MKNFIKKILLALIPLLLILLVAGTVFYTKISPQYSYGYCASIIDKLDYAASITRPKIILVGNSNVPFGFDSELLEKETGMAVVNLGIHGSLQNAFQENLAKDSLKSGDIILICHSNFKDNGKLGQASLACITIENHFDYLKFLSPKDYVSFFICSFDYMAKATGLFLSHQGNKDTKDVYSRNAFNKYGDVCYPRKPLGNLEKTELPGVSKTCMKRLKKLRRYAENKGASVLIAGYPILIDRDDENGQTEYFENFQKELEKQSPVPVICNYKDYFFDESYFYNTNLHLTNEGAKIRSKKTADDLKKYLEGKK